MWRAVQGMSFFNILTSCKIFVGRIKFSNFNIFILEYFFLEHSHPHDMYTVKNIVTEANAC
jgi:hypothetical protein